MQNSKCKFDKFVKSWKRLRIVIPAKAGIQQFQIIIKTLDPARSGIFSGETILCEPVNDQRSLLIGDSDLRINNISSIVQ